ncbi:conserved Plasmodium protein, unknown function [Plasmodium berghei]|uniref:Uncharacterized protein n=2 Tax=Plasmodium berghei TaxID=5821 RepID=A0A509AET7_PLABA|nr:conserved Plasmodium protein, unknown function [Plasmodium berghei ANKA]CXH93518.1 conserved Plasmodium protein, unknown function [Plasmodium berghei]SCL90806.1 conserved Plasmodium protein, unknown function [Plasmodium berghei]SCM15358.1 conserved Plasmodium protein, unknown function [Plasmodium berghei]SCM17151.1 conserved Plasmodium protein, unknown function [Plasmodium berghei]SCN22159.1 conserved Plasmodium protein, unknown function [Plasmodium berghei]|eukprot:XP_034419942.1 conserved Plasmodium protein, unknown function [Plasmodium berghei ANKA]
MAQNPWHITKLKELRTSKLEKVINKFQEENSHLMNIPKFKHIKNALSTIQEDSELIINKKSFNIAHICCVAQLQPTYINNVRDGIAIYLSNFMLKINHDIEGFSVCFNSIKLKEKEPITLNNDPTVMFLKISFKLLVIVLKENYKIKVKINNIEPSNMRMGIFGLIEAVMVDENFKDFYYEGKNNTFVRNNMTYSINDIISFTIRKITHADSGTNVKLLGFV